MADQKPLSQYLAEAQKKFGASPYAGAFQAGNVAPLPNLQLPTIKKAEDQTPLGWFIDILSRPMRAVENLPNQAFNEMIKQKQAQETGTPYDFWGGLANVATAPVRGFFSTNPEDQPMGADLIEKGTDAFGRAFNPNYVDVKENVNPVVAGIGGFAIDVAADPLTWIPGAQLAKGAQLVGRGAKAGLEALDAVIPAGSNLAKVTGGEARRLNAANAAKAAENINKAQQARAFDRYGITPTADRKAYEEALKAASETTLPIIRNQTEQVTAPLKFSQRTQDVIDRNKTVMDNLGEITFTEAEVSAARKLRSAEAKAVKEGLTQEAIDAQAQKIMASLSKDATAVAPKASAAIIKAAEEVPATVGDQIAAQSSAFTDVAARLEAVIAENPSQKLEFLPWVQAQLEKMKADPAYTVDVPTPGSMIPMSLGKSDLEKFLAYKKGKATEDKPLDAARNTQRDMLMVPWRAENAAINKSVGKPVTYSEFFQKLLKTKKGQKEVSNLFGEAAATRLAKMSGPQIDKSVGFLAEVLRNQHNLDNITKLGGLKVHERFAVDAMKAYGVDIPGTNAMRLRPTSEVNTPVGEEIAAAIDAGETMATAGHLLGVTRPMFERLMKWLPGFVKDDFTNIKGYKLQATKTGVALKQITKDKKIGKRPNEFNGRDQAIMWQRASKPILDEFAEANKLARAQGRMSDVIAGYNRAAALTDDVFDQYRVGMHVLDSKAAAFYTGVGKDKIRLDLLQLFSAARNAAREVTSATIKPGSAREVLNYAIFNHETSIPLTNLQDAVVALFHNEKLSDDALEAILRQEVGDGVPNYLNSKTGEGLYRHYLAMPKEDVRLNALRYVDNERHPGMAYGNVIPERMKEELMLTVRGMMPEIRKIVSDNEAMAAARKLAEGRDLTMAEFEDLVYTAADPNRMADAIRKVTTFIDDIKEEGAMKRTIPEAQGDAATLLDEAIRPEVKEAAQEAVHAEKTINKAQDFTRSPQAQDERIREISKQLNYETLVGNIKTAQKLVDDTKAARDGFSPFGKINDDLNYAMGVFELGLERAHAKIHNPLREMFDIRYGAERVVDRYTQSHIQMTHGLQKYEMRLMKVVRENKGMIPGTTTTYLTRAFQMMAKGVMPLATDSPQLVQAYAALRPLVNEVFGSSAVDNMLESIFLRGGGSIEDMEAYFAKAGLDFPFDRSAAREAAKTGNVAEVSAALAQWGTIFQNAENPVEVLSSLYRAGSQLASDKTTASLFREMSGVWSNAPRAGYVQIPKNVNPKNNPFLSHLPKGSYIEGSYLGEIYQIEKVAMANRTFGGPLGTWLRQNYMPMLANWKFGVTVLRLGHHVRNFLSSEFVQYVAEGLRHYQKSGNAALKVLMAHRGYEGVDWLQTARGIGVAKMPTGGDVLFGSKWGDVTVDAVYEAAQKKGLFVEYKQSQDVLDEMGTGKGLIKKVSDKLLFRGTKVEEVAGGIAEYQTHYNRLHHFNQILMKEANKGKFKSWNELVEYAARRVRKHHPDSTMLAPGEAKLRAVIPFYTWFRLIAPVIAEGIVTQPGRFLMFPKASFGLATSMGVDPYSLADPFPQDQLFPTWMRDQMTGPVAEIAGNYIGANPGIPYIDMLNQFVGAGPLKGLAGMTTPFARIPAEIISGTQWSTGARIKDFSDYVDANLPGINYLSNMTGYSLTGSAVTFLQGQGLDQQYQFAAGNKNAADQGLAFANWLSGLGITNMSRPNYINYAEIEKRNKKAQEKNPRSPY